MYTAPLQRYVSPWLQLHYMAITQYSGPVLYRVIYRGILFIFLDCLRIFEEEVVANSIACHIMECMVPHIVAQPITGLSSVLCETHWGQGLAAEITWVYGHVIAVAKYTMTSVGHQKRHAAAAGDLSDNGYFVISWYFPPSPLSTSIETNKPNSQKVGRTGIKGKTIHVRINSHHFYDACPH